VTAPLPILAIASAAGGCAAAMVVDGVVLAEAHIAAAQGLPAAIPPMIAALLAKSGLPGLIAVVVGPGSFTGLRAGIAVAQGLALGAGIPTVGVSVTEALAEALPALGGRTLWVALQARTGRIFLDCGDGPRSLTVDALPPAVGRIAVAGDAAAGVAARLAARGADVMLTSARQPQPRLVAMVAARRAAGLLPPLEAVPVYVDAPEAKLPAGGLRPAPV
jgi:tRNA threonylcarbamoyl adenosine modification protein YeaZ